MTKEEYNLRVEQDCKELDAAMAKWYEENSDVAKEHKKERDALMNGNYAEYLKNRENEVKTMRDSCLVDQTNIDSGVEETYSNVDHPKHYNAGKYEVIDVIEDWKLDFNLGNAIKYIGRCEHKGHKKEDLRKALWYIQREIEKNCH